MKSVHVSNAHTSSLTFNIKCREMPAEFLLRVSFKTLYVSYSKASSDFVLVIVNTCLDLLEDTNHSYKL